MYLKVRGPPKSSWMCRLLKWSTSSCPCASFDTLMRYLSIGESEERTLPDAYRTPSGSLMAHQPGETSIANEPTYDKVVARNTAIRPGHRPVRGTKRKPLNWSK